MPVRKKLSLLKKAPKTPSNVDGTVQIIGSAYYLEFTDLEFLEALRELTVLSLRPSSLDNSADENSSNLKVP